MPHQFIKKTTSMFYRKQLQYQSGFKPGNSCVNQLLAITHEIFSSFDNNYEVRGIFLDISRAFYKVQHKGIIHKLKQNGISGNLLSLLTDFLRNRKLTFKVHLGPISMLVFLKALYYARFYSYYTLRIYLIIFNVILSYPLTTSFCFILLKTPKEQLITLTTT